MTLIVMLDLVNQWFRQCREVLVYTVLTNDM